jgi:hypothetical protein
MAFELTPEVEIHRNVDGQVIQLRHMRQRYSNQEARLTNPTPAEIAAQYVRDVAGIYGLEADETTSLREAMPSGPVSETAKLRQVEEKNTSASWSRASHPRSSAPAARSTMTSISAPCPSTASPASRR